MPDPDLEIRGGRGGGAVTENTFSALGATVWSKNMGGAPPSPKKYFFCPWGLNFWREEGRKGYAVPSLATTI